MTETQPIPALCQSCGAVQDSEARFCAECGFAVTDLRAVFPDPPPQQLTEQEKLMLMLADRESPDLQLPLGSTLEPIEMASTLSEGVAEKSRRGLIVRILAAASVLAAIAVLGLNDYGTHQRLTRTADAYSASQSQLKATRATLGATVTQLTGVQSTLTSTKSDLTTTKTTLNTTKATLAAKEQDLTGVRNNLNDAKSSLTIKSGQVETLKSCLNGVSIAFRDLANGDYPGTISALDAVQVSCKSAFSIL